MTSGLSLSLTPISITQYCLTPKLGKNDNPAKLFGLLISKFEGEQMKRISILLFVLSIIAASLYAHHGRGATYDMKKRVTLKGTVSRVDWRNPHVVIFMDVKDEAGKVVTWGFENAGVSQLAQEGYNRNTLKIGQEITAIVNPAANGSPTAIVVKVILADGSEIMSRERGQNPVD
jgi:Family of unknown function (DUF6152)